MKGVFFDTRKASGPPFDGDQNAGQAGYNTESVQKNCHFSPHFHPIVEQG